MAVGACQPVDEYKKTMEYIRNLCEGSDMEGRELTPPSANGAGECVPDLADGLGRLNGKQESGAVCRHNGATNDAANDTCDTCGQPGQFICCELCPRVFHFLCVEPPMSHEEVSKVDHWYCRACQHLVTRKRKSRAHAKSIFYPLLSALEFQNARTFSVPEEIRRQFDGIEADIDGSFINTREDRPQRVNLGATNRDFTRLVDDHNTPIMCYRCGLSALHGPVVRCDYCPLNWHWDCLDPPLSSAPPSRKRWMCPNHADHVMPRRHKFRKERIVDLTDAPETVRNSGIIDIVDDDPPYQELFDPKVKYRLTTTRIRKEFSKNASVCHVFPAPPPPKQTLALDLATKNVGTSAVGAMNGDDVASSDSPDSPVAEWLLAISDFQKDVARYVAAPELRAELRDACRKRRYDDSEMEEGTSANSGDRIALLSGVASQILSPYSEATGLNTPVLSSTSSALVNGAAGMSIASEPDAQQFHKRRRVLEEYGVCETDLKVAATELLNRRLLSSTPIHNASSCAGGDAAPTLGGGDEQPGPTAATSNADLELPQYEADPTNTSTSTVPIPDSPVVGDEVDESHQYQLASASSVIEHLLRKKGADALVAFLLSD
ncbi:hypothetical protein LPJ60_004327 [Coemansia sp. RSA 2675]|nr:hypothetical protein LPJ60_004327 [Coemansia sp. RSA 2675]